MWYSAYGRSQADTPMEGKRGWEANSIDKVTTLKTKTDIITLTLLFGMSTTECVTFFPNLKQCTSRFKIFHQRFKKRGPQHRSNMPFSRENDFFFWEMWCFCHVSVECTSKRAGELEYLGTSSKIPPTCGFPHASGMWRGYPIAELSRAEYVRSTG